MVTIIGGGISGLTLALLLHRQDIPFHVYEARDRLGGRILSRGYQGPQDVARFDLGPSWYWPEFQPRMKSLVEALPVSVFDQWDYGESLYQSNPHSPPERFRNDRVHAHSYRLDGGFQSLIDAIAAELPQGSISLSHRAARVMNAPDGVCLQLEHGDDEVEVHSRIVVSTIPPRLLSQSVHFQPALDPYVHRVMRETPTWMATAAKFVAQFDEPFWRTIGLSGNLVSRHAGAVLAEVHDASAPGESNAALMGFIAVPPDYRRALRHHLRSQIVGQLEQSFGTFAKSMTHLHIQDWARDPFTATPLERGNGVDAAAFGDPVITRAYWDDKLHFAGAETSVYFGGYLEGAVESAYRVYQRIHEVNGSVLCA